MSLSVAYITKNQNESLIKSIKSIKDIADEIIIIVTNSFDNNIIDIWNGLYEDHKIKIILSNWNNNFSKARNEALSFCTSDFVLILDDDEACYEHQKLKELMQEVENLNISAWEVTQLTDIQGVKVPCQTIRLFKNHKGIEYSYKVHESIEPSLLEMNLKAGKSDLVIEHWGYQTTDIEKINNINTILQSDNHPYKEFYLGCNYFILKEFKLSNEYLLKFISIDREPSVKAYAYSLLAQIHCKHLFHSLELVQKYLTESLKSAPNQNTAHIIASEIYETQGNGKNAIKELEILLQKNNLTYSDMFQDTIPNKEILKEKIKEIQNGMAAKQR